MDGPQISSANRKSEMDFNNFLNLRTFRKCDSADLQNQSFFLFADLNLPKIRKCFETEFCCFLKRNLGICELLIKIGGFAICGPTHLRT
jgi:hypothetical protein